MTSTLTEMFSYTFLVRAFIVGILVSLCASLLGVSLVLKRYSMIGDGLSHVGFGALAIATALNLAPLSVALPIVISAAFFLLRLKESSKIRGDAAIAMISTAALAFGVLVISRTSGANTDINNYLFGSILAMTQVDVYLSIALCAVVLILFTVFYNMIFAITFDEIFVKTCGVKTGLYNMLIAFLTAVIIVLGMRMMGAMLISGLIIFPTLSAMRVCNKFKTVTICSAFVAVICYFLGLVISYEHSSPTGAAIVMVNIVAFVILSLVNYILSAKHLKKITVKKTALVLLTVMSVFAFSSCSRSLGWGMMLWSSESGGIPSGTVVRVYIKSNIEKVWIIGVPREYKKIAGTSKVEVPLPQLELCGTKAAAQRRAKQFAQYALSYAETIQDGLPIRVEADNSARRVYRLRYGEIVKILEKVRGNPAISATGDPLPGDWYKVLTEDGTEGCCFSYRLRLFEHSIGEIAKGPVSAPETDEKHDVDLDAVLSAKWVAETYGTMIDENKLDLDSLERHWGFFIGEDTGIATVYTQDADASFKYKKIDPQGGRTWHFDGTNLSMRMRTPSLLTVMYIDEKAFAISGMNGAQKSINFITIDRELDDLIAEESQRRSEAYAKILGEGPRFESEFYGKISFNEEREILWENFDILIPSVLDISTSGKGTVELKYFLNDSLKNDFDGVLTMVLKTIGAPDQAVNFLYSTDSGGGLGGLRLEYVPDWCMEETTVLIRDSSPMSMYFYEAER
ncbi:hypothetical protein FACS1894102_6630 [Spirochaetia bacterium]|nr:hypothetical protein FACS1894102_6630 [Spirochaetia bacterium]